MLAPVIVDLGPDVGARETQIVIAACNHAISQGVCLPETSLGDEAPRAVAVARAADSSVRVVRIEVRLGDESGASIVRELVFGRRDPLRERWRSVGLAIATLVGEGERAREEAEEQTAAAPLPAPEEPERAESPATEPEPEPPAPARPAPPPVAVEEPEEEEVEEEPEVPRAPYEHRSWFIGVGGLAGPGFGEGPWRLGGTLRGAWQSESGLTFGVGLGYARRSSSEDFTAEWLSAEAGVGYRLVASDALSFGALVFGGAQRARFEVLAGGEERSQVRWNPRVGLELDGRWRATAGFGIWAAVAGSSPGRESRLFVAPTRDPIRSSALDISAAAGLGWWLE